MLVFSSTSDPVSAQSLEIKLSTAPSAELAWVSSYGDNGETDLDLLTQTGTTNSTTEVTVVTAPPENSDDYFLKSFNVKNQNSATATVIMQYNDNGTQRELLRVTLSQHDSLVYEESYGWYVLDSVGNIKVTYKITDLGILAQSAPGAATLTDLLTVAAGFWIDKGHVVCANRGAATALRISIAPDGAADATSQYIAYDLPIDANNVYDSAEFVADAADVVRVYNTLANVTFSVFANRKPINS